MTRFTLNGREVQCEPGTTLIRAAKTAGVSVPYYCWHPALSIAGNCRMCLVEVEKQPKLQIACQTVAADGMVVHTESEKVQQARRAVMEFLFIHHPLDCPVCDQAGECKLQEYYMRYERIPSRYVEPKNDRPKVEDWGQMVVYDGERCINCTRCIRVMAEFARQDCLGQVNRGSRTYVATFNNEPLPHGYSGNVVDFCPVGALTLKDFRFKQRVWFLKSAPSVCAGCARGCLTRVDQRDDRVYRVVPRGGESGHYFMCDDGRLHYKQANDLRLLAGQVGAAAARRDEALAAAGRMLGPIVQQEAGGLGVAVSASVTCEDAYAVGILARDVLGARVVYVLGRPDGVEDEILMRADRSANRRGVLAVLGGLGLEAVDLRERPAALKDALEKGVLKGLYVAGTDLRDELGVAGPALERAEVLVVAANNLPALPQSCVALPATTYLEGPGTFVNFEGRVRRLMPVIAPRGEALPHWRLAHLMAAALGRDLGCSVLSAFRADADQLVRAATAPGDGSTAQAAMAPA